MIKLAIRNEERPKQQAVEVQPYYSTTRVFDTVTNISVNSANVYTGAYQISLLGCYALFSGSLNRAIA
jgi:hypothetical protein